MAEHWQQGPVLITGGTGLVGRAIAAAFAGTGAVTVAVGSDAERTRKAAAVFAADSLPIHAICADMSDPAEINRVFEAVELQHGTVAVLVNAAGINFNRMIADVGVEDFDRLFRTNVRAAFFSSRTACERMIAASLAGRVVNITSGNYRYARPDAALYAATKSALEMLTRGFALEYGEYGIAVNAVAPGLVDRPGSQDPAFLKVANYYRGQSSQKILTTARDVASAVMFLASANAASIGGETIVVDGGFSAGRLDFPRRDS